MLGSGKARTGRPKLGDERSGRDMKLCIRISKRDLRILERVCSFYGITKTDYIIQMIRSGEGMVKEIERCKTQGECEIDR